MPARFPAKGVQTGLSGGCTAARLLVGASALFAVARPTSAEPVLIEMQLPSDAVTKLIWDRLYTEEICALDTFPFPYSTTGDAVLDRVEFREQPWTVNAGGSAELIVRADVFLRPATCLSAACGSGAYLPMADPLMLELAYLLELDLDVQTDPGKPQATLCMALVSLRDIATDQTVPADLLPADLVAVLEGLDCSTFPLGALKRNLLGDDASISRTGISVSGDGSRIGLRFEVNGPSSDSDASWNQFFNGQLAPTDASMDWSLFIDPRLLEEKVRSQIDEEMTCKENPRLPECFRDFDGDGIFCDVDMDDPKCDEAPAFQRTSGPTASWSGGGANGGGHIHVDVVGEIPGGFSETPCPNTIHVDPVEIDVDLRVEASDPGWMKSRIVIDPDPDDDDVALCALLLATPTLDIATLVTLLVVGIVADSYDPSASQVGLDLTCDDITAPTCLRYCTQLEDDEYDCADRLNVNEPLDVGGPTLGILHLTKMVGTGQGAILGGAVEQVVRPVPVGPLPLPPNPFIRRQKLRVGSGAITEGVQGGCSNLNWGYSGDFSVWGDGVLCLPVQEVDDPPAGHANTTGIYDILWPYTGSKIGQQVIKIAFPATGSQSAIDEFFLDPYPLEFLVRSSVGFQYRTIPAPAPPDDARRIEELSKAFLECESRSWGLRLPQRALDMFWLPNPPPFEILLQVGYIGQPPAGETHAAYLTEITAQTLGTFVPVPSADVASGISFPNTGVLFEGTVDIDLGSLGQIALPFSLDFEPNLYVTDLQPSLEAELAMGSNINFALKTPPEELPAGVRLANVQFSLAAEDLRYGTAFFQIAGPADFDENGDVTLVDWPLMVAGTNGPDYDTLEPLTNFDDDSDTDLKDMAAFQNWFTVP